MVFDAVSPETLRHNPKNEVTAGVERVTDAAGRTLIKKRLRRPVPAATPQTNWSASTDPRHWNYWRREADVYRSAELRASLERAGLGLPEAEVEEHQDGATLWLEDVAGTSGTAFTLADHVAVAEAAGRWQAQGPLHTAWSSECFLRTYSSDWDVRYELVDDDAAWQQPLVRDNWPAGLPVPTTSRPTPRTSTAGAGSASATWRAGVTRRSPSPTSTADCGPGLPAQIASSGHGLGLPAQVTARITRLRPLAPAVRRTRRTRWLAGAAPVRAGAEAAPAGRRRTSAAAPPAPRR